ncbi:PGPGW domain-containing protein [Streptomyces sp. NPDC051954]|uniref:PGPGW domain-containing protein n=1 Tax=Streptomyces sp. NPDC051954 TaxID=3155524 RepID=UPI0034161A47
MSKVLFVARAEPLPRPGWPVIFAGMELWATEFIWAQRVLSCPGCRVTEATRRAMDPRVRHLNIAVLTAGAALCAAAVTRYLYCYGVVVPWDWRLSGVHSACSSGRIPSCVRS